MNKLMLLHHIRTLPISSLARQINDAEGLNIEGLNYEMKMFCELNQVRQPSAELTKEEYKKYLTGRLGALMEQELREKIRNSSTMSKLSEEKFEMKEYLTTKKLETSRFLYGCRSGTTDQLVGNVHGKEGSTTCLCGSARETSAHVTECPLYLVCSEGLPQWRHNADESLTYWLRLLRLRADLKKHIPATPSPSP